MATEVDRLPQITPTAYHEALRATKWDLMAANATTRRPWHRKRDQREGPHESLDAIGARRPSARPRTAPSWRELLAETDRGRDHAG
jgi:hypothetical protein